MMQQNELHILQFDQQMTDFLYSFKQNTSAINYIYLNISYTWAVFNTACFFHEILGPFIAN